MASSGAGGSSGGGASAAYGKAVGGRLKLKTVAAPATSVAASGGSGGAGGVAGVKRPRDGGDPRPSAAAPPPSSSSSSSGAAAAAAAAAPAVTAPSRTAGSGRIVTSGTAVYGIDTAFSTELAVGDAIEVAHPTSGVAEVRVIKMVLSDKSVGINAPFSTDLAAGVAYHVLKLPKVVETAEMAAAAAASKRAVEEKAAFGTFASDGGKTYTYREQKGGTYGSYKVVSVALDGSKTREELLELRSKVKSDKYC